MKGLLYGIAISFSLSLTACSEAQFKSIADSSQKAESVPGDTVPSETIPVVDVPADQMDEVVDRYECDEVKKRTCHSHDSQAEESYSSKKALVCHHAGNGRGVEICISKNALQAHIDRHGRDGGEEDYFGECKDDDSDDSDDSTHED